MDFRCSFKYGAALGLLYLTKTKTNKNTSVTWNKIKLTETKVIKY